jgi:hypothetical protein
MTSLGASNPSGALVAVLAGAVLAALGYVGKLIVQQWQDSRAAATRRRTELLRLQALLRATRTAFLTQGRLRNELFNQLPDNHPQIPRSEPPDDQGYEDLFSDLYPEFTKTERDLHRIIRAYTEHALRPANEELRNWLASDIDHRAPRTRANRQVKDLAVKLNQLDTHLLLWLAKYKVWIPHQPKHALCYTDDEHHHGVEFPHGIDKVLDTVVNAQRGLRQED